MWIHHLNIKTTIWFHIYVLIVCDIGSWFYNIVMCLVILLLVGFWLHRDLQAGPTWCPFGSWLLSLLLLDAAGGRVWLCMCALAHFSPLAGIPGVQKQIVHCVEKTTGIVEEQFCDPLTRPDNNQTSCNKDPCPAMWVHLPDIIYKVTPAAFTNTHSEILVVHGNKECKRTKTKIT